MIDRCLCRGGYRAAWFRIPLRFIGATFALLVMITAQLYFISETSAATLTTPTVRGHVAMKSWKDLRDADIVMQKLDFSCGAASLATILKGFYGYDVTELDILTAIGKEKDVMLSFSELAKVMPKYGFNGVGLALSVSDLQKFTVPAIVYLRINGQDHFAVLRSITKNMVWLADPAWGNRRLSIHQFLEIWETRDDRERPGKVLLVLPAVISETKTIPTYFGKRIETSELPIKLLNMRH